MANVNHESRAHALLSASQSDMWIHCGPSALLNQKAQESKQSVFAEEGTLAHEFGQINIQVNKLVNQLSEKIHGLEIKKLRKHKLYSEEMEPEVLKYTDYVLETFNTIKKVCPDAILLVEERLDFSHLVEGGFGTGDICIIADGVLWIIDLKYGKGVKVFAEENSQLKLYGLGALRKFEMLYDIHTVMLVIVQPRLDHIDEWSISVDNLFNWGETIVRPAAVIAHKGTGTQVVGKWCKFCKVKSMCRAMADKNLELAKHDFKDPHLLTDTELIEIYEQTPILVNWANSISKFILEAALAGKKWPGYKVVEGKSNRKWLDETKVAEILELNNWKEHKKEDFYKTAFKGIGDVEKMVGKLWFSNALAGLVIKPQGAPTLTTEADPRTEIQSIQAAKNDFIDDEKDELNLFGD